MATHASPPSRRRTAALPGRITILALGALATCASLLVGGCARELPADSPEVAFTRLIDACNDHDTARLFDVLDTPTQWAIETVHKAQREMRGLIVDSYPESERDRALARLPAACAEDLERPRRYYRALPESEQVLREVDERLHKGSGQPIGSVRKKEGIAEVWREGGSLFHFFRDDKGRWGLMEQRDLWERAKERALHELETVKGNAALYRQRAGGGARTVPATAPEGKDEGGGAAAH